MNPWLRAVLFLLALLLCGIALLTGGCSLLFTPSLWGSGEFEGPDLWPIWAAGLAIAAACIALAVFLFRRISRPEPPSAKTFDPPPNNPGAP